MGAVFREPATRPGARRGAARAWAARWWRNAVPRFKNTAGSRGRAQATYRRVLRRVPGPRQPSVLGCEPRPHRRLTCAHTLERRWRNSGVAPGWSGCRFATLRHEEHGIVLREGDRLSPPHACGAGRDSLPATGSGRRTSPSATPLSSTSGRGSRLVLRARWCRRSSSVPSRARGGPRRARPVASCHRAGSPSERHLDRPRRPRSLLRRIRFGRRCVARNVVSDPGGPRARHA
jgi:hypothetical protein